MYSDKNNQTKSIGVVGGSVTTYTQLNPAFTVYTYNRTTNRIIDFEIWWTDLIQNPDNPNWVHVSYVDDDKNRKQTLTINANGTFSGFV